MPDTRMVCKTCYIPVSPYYGADAPTTDLDSLELQGWAHLDRQGEPHEVIPIPADEADYIDQVCDFCSKPNISWIIKVPGTLREVFPGTFVNDTAWAACDECRGDAMTPGITPRELAERVCRRAVPNYDDAKLPPAMREVLLARWSELYVAFLKQPKELVPLQEWVS